MKKNDSLEAHAIKLFVELYGWVYTVGERVLEDDIISQDIVLRWIGLTTNLERKAKQLYNAVPCDTTKRGWVRALELKTQFNDRQYPKAR